MNNIYPNPESVNRELEELRARTANYYDSLSAEDQTAERAWGELGELGLATAR